MFRKVGIISVAVTFICIFFSCKHSQVSQSKQIIGDDNRGDVRFSELANRIGLLQGPTTKCNASLIAPNVLVTALHCIQKGREKNFTFFTADNSFHSKVSSIKSEDKNSDIVYLYLENKSLHFFEIDNLSELKDAEILAYDSEKGVVTDLTSCTRESVGKIFEHSCDTIPGYSGAAFVLKGKLVAIHLGYDYASHKNIGLRFTSDNSVSLSSKIFVPEVACGDDCYRHCRRKVFGEWIPNPPCEATCVVERQLDCSASKDLEVCGVKLTVPAITYVACKGAIALLPAACTVGTATSAGAACALNIGAATAVCGISGAVTAKIAAACANGK
jgi:hypothetical protein